MNKRLLSALDATGLTHLVNAFEAQGIDDSVVDDLSDADLQAIGVDKLGDRKKLLKAFASASFQDALKSTHPVGKARDCAQNPPHLRELEELIRAAQPAFTRYMQEQDRLAGNFDERPQYPSFEIAGIGNHVVKLMNKYGLKYEFPKVFDENVDPSSWSEEDFGAGTVLRDLENKLLFNETIPAAPEMAYLLASVSASVAPSMWQDAIEWRLGFLEHCGIGCSQNTNSAIARFEKVASYYDKFTYALAQYYCSGMLSDPCGVCHDIPALETIVSNTPFPRDLSKAGEWAEKYQKLVQGADNEAIEKALADLKKQIIGQL